ncbi:SusC/RagA family TonB-linked outer membrane protein [Pedobacter arcticus]|uniref:SusC/RagA family TonB-linked outer membrane protein n=1 Tax=Pedobacter arcticus TaxID=752140 RepID=UPI0002F60393|nr:TonB-dependent receptor [Pedobacter arcticus]
MKKSLYILLIILAICPVLAVAQTRIKGVVKDAGGPLPGVAVAEKGIQNITITDGNGAFDLTLKGSSNIVTVSSVGYQQQTLTVANGQTLEIILRPSTQDLNEVVVVGFGTVKRITNTGSVSSVKGAAIRDIPTSSLQNALQGKVPGFIAQQRSGQPGKDASDFYIRGVSSLNSEGNQPLIIVDDIEFTYEQFSQINVNEVESVSILKDASTTAIYGIKGANGVLVVTTRRGASGVPKISVRVESGMQSPSNKLDFLNSFESATLVNEAYGNDGRTLPFTQTDLDHFRTGDDPYGHPDIDWYDRIFKQNTFQYNTNIDISGGDKTIKYFIAGGAFSQNGLVRDFYDPRSQVNSNYYYRRYNLRSNLDVQASKSLSLRLDVRGGFNQINRPFAGNVVSEIYDFSRLHPYSAPFLNPDGSYAYASDTQGLLPTINARLATQGYDLDRRNDLNILFGGTQKLDDLTKGLSLSAKIAYASVESNTREQFRGTPPSYLYDTDKDTYTLNGPNYTLSNYTLRAYQGEYNSRINLQGLLNYVRDFGDHHVTGLLLFNRESYKTKANLTTPYNWIPQNFKGVTFRTGYNYKEKYMLDLTGAYNGSDRFGANKRYGFFPAISIGYNIANEDFFKKYTFVDLLKLRTSYGLVGSDKVQGNQYLYEQVYLNGGGYSFGETDKFAPSKYEGPLGNPNVGWEKQRSFDVGLDVNLFNSKFNLTFDYFNNVRYDQLIVSQSLPLNVGIGVSPTNIAKVRNQGFDGEIGYHNKIGNVDYNVSGVFTFAKNKVLYQDEPAVAYPWLAQTGRPIGQQFGYTFIGFYKDQADIDASAKPSSGVIQPGDLKYKDLNEDGVIDQYDQGAIGKPNSPPTTTLGLTLGGSYKGFSLNVLFQGSTGYSFGLVGTGIQPLQSQFQPIHQKRWTPGTSETATFPRLSTNPTNINSPASYLSDFWLIDVTYVRLKTVELGYQLPEKLLPFKISNVRFYLSGYNLFTWKNYSLYQQDPEVSSLTAGDAYFNQRVINIGVQIGL